MPHFRDDDETRAWTALFVLACRSLSICMFLFATVDWNVLLRDAIQLHEGAKADSSTPLHERSGESLEGNHQENDGAQDLASRRQPQTTNLTHQPHPSVNTSSHPSKHRPQTPPSQPTYAPPPPYSLSPSKTLPPKPTASSIISLYEDIMASDSQTIQVQQETLISQQNVICSQAQMIRNMRQVLEEQDARIEELEGRLTCVRRIAG